VSASYVNEKDPRMPLLKQTPETVWPTRAEMDGWPIAEAGLCNRAVHCFTAAGLKTIGELRGLRPADMLRLPHFGRRSLQNVQWFFRWTRRIEKQDVPFHSLPAMLVELLNQPEIFVLEHRYGLLDPLFRPHLKWRTLQDIADVSGGLTRERVRQIEATGLERLRFRLSRTLMSPLEAHLVSRLVLRGGIVTCRELADWVNDPALGRYQPWGSLRLLADVGRRIHNYFDYYTILPPETVARVETKALEFLQRHAEPQPLASLVALLQPELGHYAGDCERTLQVMLEHHPAIDATRDGSFFLGTKSAAWFITSLLKDAGSVVPLETLQREYNQRMIPRSQKSPQALVRVLGELPSVARVGAGLYQWRKAGQ